MFFLLIICTHWRIYLPAQNFSVPSTLTSIFLNSGFAVLQLWYFYFNLRLSIWVFPAAPLTEGEWERVSPSNAQLTSNNAGTPFLIFTTNQMTAGKLGFFFFWVSVREGRAHMPVVLFSDLIICLASVPRVVLASWAPVPTWERCHCKSTTLSLSLNRWRHRCKSVWRRYRNEYFTAFERETCQVTLKHPRCFVWDFLVPDLSEPTLGLEGESVICSVLLTLVEAVSC